MLGLPETGKTTFLAALWHCFQQSHDDLIMELEKINGDLDYLNDIRSIWLKCESMPRTGLNVHESVEFVVRERNSGEEIELILPDLSGELFEKQWEDAIWSNEFYEYAREIEGIILFLHPEAIKKPIRLVDTISIENVLPSENLNIDPSQTRNNHSAEGLERATIPWTRSMAPTQVQLVGVLQQILSKANKQPLRIALVVSAWDLIKNTFQSPEFWLQEQLPLLNQFLVSNQESFMFTVLGVSAQGGKLPEDAEKLLEMPDHTKRIELIHNGETSTDITLPIWWMTK